MRFRATFSWSMAVLTLLVYSVGSCMAAEAADDESVLATEKAKRVAGLFTGDFFFHGVLVDQYGDPVTGAEVVLLVNRMSAFLGGLKNRYSHPKATSDAHGKFSFTDEKGYLFYIESISKPGYQFLLRQYCWNYQTHGTPVPEEISAPNRPCVIQGWKSAPPEEVAEIDIGRLGPRRPIPRISVRSTEEFSRRSRFRIVVSGDPAANPENTWSGRVEVVPTTDNAADWDLEMFLDPTAQMPEPLEGRTNKEDPLLPPWFPTGTAVRVRAKHGGVQQADRRYPYLAPETGYQESVALDWANSEASLPTDRDFAVYYVDKRTSHYAYVRIRYEAGNAMDEKGQPQQERKQIATIKLTDGSGQPAGVVNPHGSRVLEYSESYNCQQIELRMKPIRDKEQAERDAYREANLDWFRKNNPMEARLIEERMRSQGKVVPPVKTRDEKIEKEPGK